MKTVLIVQDDAVSQRLLSYKVRAAGHALRIATTLAEAHAAVAADPPSLILVDLHLPDGKGIDLIREARGVPVMVLSGRRQPDMVLQAFDAGAIDYIAKPFDPDDVMRRIERALAGTMHGPTEHGRPPTTEERRTDAPQIGGQATEAHESSRLRAGELAYAG